MLTIPERARRPGNWNVFAALSHVPGMINLILQRRIYPLGLTFLALFRVVLAVGPGDQRLVLFRGG